MKIILFKNLKTMEKIIIKYNNYILNNIKNDMNKLNKKMIIKIIIELVENENYMLKTICENGCLDILKKIKFNDKHGIPLMIFFAASSGKINILDYLWNKHLKKEIYFNFDNRCIDFAVRNGHLKVIKWFWKKFKEYEKIDFKYSDHFILIDICLYRRMDILKWFKTKNLKLTYSNLAVKYGYEENINEIK